MNNINLKYLIHLVIISFFTLSCEEVIELDLNEIDPKLVIQGNVSDKKDSAIVTIDKTRNFYDAYNKDEIISLNVSSVIIIDDSNDTLILTEQKKGYFSCPFNFTTYNKTYKLEVIESGNLYTATSTMKETIPISNISITDFEPYWDSTWYPEYDKRDSLMLTIYLDDRKDEYNCYRVKLFVNDSLREATAWDYMVFDDFSYEGATIPVMFNEYFRVGDKVYIELLQYDKAVFDFWNTLIQSKGQADMGGTPYNPTTNFDQDEIFGYFAAYSVDTISIPVNQSNKIMQITGEKNLFLPSELVHELNRVDTSMIDTSLLNSFLQF